MRSKRFKNLNCEKSKLLEMDITSLLDILVILLVFLLKSYNATDLKLDMVKNLTIPSSKSRLLGSHAVIVQVNKNRDIWLNNQKIGNIYEHGEQISPLYEKLMEIQKENEKLENNIKPDSKPKRRKINLVMDRKLSYGTLRKIMHTSALAGYPEFKFIVQGNY